MTDKIREIPNLERDAIKGAFTEFARWLPELAANAAAIARARRDLFNAYVGEFAFRLNEGDVKHHTLDRLASLFDASIGQRLTYKELIA